MGLVSRSAPEGDGEWISEFIIGEGSQQRVRVRQWVRKDGNLSSPGYKDYYGSDSLPGKSQSAEEYIRQAQTGLPSDSSAPIADEVAEAHQRQFDVLTEETKNGITNFYIQGPLMMAGFAGAGAVKNIASIIDETAAAAGAAKGATRLMDSRSIRYSQDSIGSKFSDGSDVEDLVSGLNSGRVKPDDVQPIRIFHKNGKMYTLDNRRLYAAQKAGKPIRVREATAEELRNELTGPKNKFTTPNDGESIRVRGSNGTGSRSSTTCENGDTP
jgi:hypothetical protein